VGMGRMCEPEDIFQIVVDYFKFSNSLVGKKILVNAGPTHEKIDPVRFIGNYSSGKMGKAIANTLAERGANVELVLGPVDTDRLSPKINITSITSAQEMYEACHAIFPSCDAGILAAAVADFTPSEFSNQKIKKGEHDEFQFTMSRTHDVLASLGESKTKQQILVGFALETHDELNHAQKKLDKKNLDFIVLNSMNDAGAGFAKDTNKVTIIEKNGKNHTFDTKSKKEVSKDIVNLLQNYL
jgi:phosphopantothenoylcysteine decarboxylase/phosphopantothenate--cysteine ligase